MHVPFARLAFCLALAIVTFFALVPGPLGAIIESGEERHVLAFAALPVLSAIGWPAWPARAQFVGYALFGAGIEVAQEWMAVGRKAELGDWLIDMLAAAVALLIVRRLMRGLTPRPA